MPREICTLSCPPLPSPLLTAMQDTGTVRTNARLHPPECEFPSSDSAVTLDSLVPNLKEQVPASCYQDQRGRRVALAHFAMGHCNIAAVLGPDPLRTNVYHTQCIDQEERWRREAFRCEGFMKLTNQKTAGQGFPCAYTVVHPRSPGQHHCH